MNKNCKCKLYGAHFRFKKNSTVIPVYGLTQGIKIIGHEPSSARLHGVAVSYLSLSKNTCVTHVFAHTPENLKYGFCEGRRSA